MDNYREMRRKEKQVPESEAHSILDRAEFMTLATVLPDGSPYAVPLNHVTHNGAIYFHCAMEGQKNDAFRGERRVCVSAVESCSLVPEKFSTDYRSACVFGSISQVTENSEKLAALKEIIKKFSPGFIESGNAYIDRMAEKTAVYRIDISHITGKVSRKKG